MKKNGDDLFEGLWQSVEWEIVYFLRIKLSSQMCNGRACHLCCCSRRRKMTVCLSKKPIKFCLWNGLKIQIVRLSKRSKTTAVPQQLHSSSLAESLGQQFFFFARIVQLHSISCMSHTQTPRKRQQTNLSLWDMRDKSMRANGFLLSYSLLTALAQNSDRPKWLDIILISLSLNNNSTTLTYMHIYKKNMLDANIWI